MITEPLLRIHNKSLDDPYFGPKSVDSRGINISQELTVFATTLRRTSKPCTRQKKQNLNGL
jgi:hypothetical protein